MLPEGRLQGPRLSQHVERNLLKGLGVIGGFREPLKGFRGFRGLGNLLKGLGVLGV